MNKKTSDPQYSHSKTDGIKLLVKVQMDHNYQLNINTQMKKENQAIYVIFVNETKRYVISIHLSAMINYQKLAESWAYNYVCTYSCPPDNGIQYSQSIIILA